jgi:hypothetical protein
MENHAPQLAIAWALYFFSKSSVASLRKIGRRRFAAFDRSQGNDTSMRSLAKPAHAEAQCISFPSLLLHRDHRSEVTVGAG